MGYPRSRIVDSSTAGFYHCISRCVRRAFLCGDEYDHRRQWFEQRLAELLDVFTIEACAYAIMCNHLHLILKTDPKAARGLTDLEVARRWIQLYPADLHRRKQAAGSPAHASRIETAYLQSIVADHRKIARWRDRLASISWFNKLLKEPIARRANREDDCTGHFWEGRFKSIRLLDQCRGARLHGLRGPQPHACRYGQGVAGLFIHVDPAPAQGAASSRSASASKGRLKSEVPNHALADTHQRAV